MRNSSLVALASILLFSATSAANAGIMTFSGYDPGWSAAPPAGPNSAAAQASFLATPDPADPTESLITFETALPADVTISGGTITNATSGFALFGGNTTLSGGYYLSLEGGTATFNFAKPISDFGAYFSGMQVDETLTFNDGSPETVTVPGGGTSINDVGGMAFAGFIDPGASISSITVNAVPSCGNCDIIGVDDVYYSYAGSAVPEPSSWAMLLIGFAGLGYVGYRASRKSGALPA